MAGSRFSMEAILSLTDQLTGPYRNSTRRITALNRGLSGSFKRLNAGIKKTVGAVGRQMKRAAIVGLGVLALSVGVAAKEFVALDASITQAGAKFKDLDTTSQTYKDTLGQLSTAARKVGSDTEFSAVDAAGALDKFAMAGFTSAQSMALLRGTTNLATAAGTDLTTAVDIATDSLGAFNLVTDDTIQLEKNLARVSDVMAKTTTTANTSLEDMFESVKAGAPAFTAAGQSVESFAALTGILANSGLKGSIAGTNLRNVMLRLAKPTGEAADVLKSLGVQTQDAKGNFRDVIDILGDFEKGLVGMGTQQKTAALATVFGARAVTGVNILLGEGSEKLREYREELINSAGASKTMAEAIRGSIGNQIKVLKSGLTELGLQFIEAFEEQGRGALSKLIEFVQGFNMEPVIKAVRKVGRFMLKIFSNLETIFKDLQPVLVQTGKAMLKIVNVLVPILIPAFKFLGEVVALVLPLVNELVDFIGDLVTSFRESGAAEKMVRMFARLKEIMIPVVGVFIDIIRTVKDFIIESGLLETIVPLFGLVVGAVGLLGGAFKLMWGVVKPIIKFMQMLLEPILFIVRELVEGIGIVGDIFGRDAQGPPQRSTGQRGTGGSGLAESTSARGRASRQQVAVEQQRVTEENRQRNDVFLHAPIGVGMSGEPGGSPELAIKLGVQ